MYHLATDLDGDRLTDLLADVWTLRAYGDKVLKYVGSDKNMSSLWKDMGYTTGNGRDMTSVMHRWKVRYTSKLSDRRTLCYCEFSMVMRQLR